jgi:hypothetical protein
MMQTQQSLFEIELTKLVASEVDRMKDILAFNNFSDVSQFKYVMGVITGLKSINDLVDTAREKSEQRNR